LFSYQIQIIILLVKIKAIIVLFTACLFIACSSSEDEEQRSYSFLALGDSYTIGQGVEASSRWPDQLALNLSRSGIEIDSLKIIAKTGWTTGDLLRAVDREQPGQFDMVSLLIGVNNQFQGLSFRDFGLEFNNLLNVAISIAEDDARVFVVSIPDYGVTPFGASNRDQIAEEIDQYNDYIREECQSRGIPFIDVTGISRELGGSSMALAPDGLHPSGYQYKMWVDSIQPVVENLLLD
jgi:lysophospholipase L1-like esterase